ncbi:hypothetical protein BC830DRAFT_1119992 [Chytriomyces sp. MP71]|nr:hypothetical protein BC830DRAFT_1119992 [Chytriomyces sp. MP71]
MTRVQVLPGQRVQQQTAPAPNKTQPQQQSAKQRAAAPAAKQSSMVPADMQFRGKENVSAVNSSRATPVPQHQPNAKVQHGVQKQQSQQQPATPRPLLSKKPSSAQQPDWCEDKSMTNLHGKEEDELWFNAYLFGSAPKANQSPGPSAEEDELWYMAYLFGTHTKPVVSAPSKSQQYKLRIAHAARAPRVPNSQLQRRQARGKRQSQAQLQENVRFVATLFGTTKQQKAVTGAAPKTKTNYKLRIAHAARAPHVTKSQLKRRQGKGKKQTPAQLQENAQFVANLFGVLAKQQSTATRASPKTKTKVKLRIALAARADRVLTSQLQRRQRAKKQTPAQLQENAQFVASLFGAPMKQPVKKATTNYRARVFASLRAPRVPKSQLQRRPIRGRNPLSMQEKHENSAFVQNLFNFGVPANKPSTPARQVQVRGGPRVAGILTRMKVAAVAEPVPKSQVRGRKYRKWRQTPAQLQENAVFVQGLFGASKQHVQQQRSGTKWKSDIRARIALARKAPRVPRSQWKCRARTPTIQTPAMLQENAAFAKSLFAPNSVGKQQHSKRAKTNYKLRIHLALQAPHIPKSQLKRRIKSRKQATLAERQEVSQFVANLFASAGPKFVPVKKQQELQAKQKTNYKLRIQHALKCPHVSKNQLKRRLRVKRQQTSAEREEIHRFVNVELFPAPSHQRLGTATRGQKEAMTTTERNEICHFVTHLFDAPKPMPVRRVQPKTRKILFLSECFLCVPFAANYRFPTQRLTSGNISDPKYSKSGPTRPTGPLGALRVTKMDRGQRAHPVNGDVVPAAPKKQPVRERRCVFVALRLLIELDDSRVF